MTSAQIGEVGGGWGGVKTRIQFDYRQFKHFPDREEGVKNPKLLWTSFMDEHSYVFLTLLSAGFVLYVPSLAFREHIAEALKL